MHFAAFPKHLGFYPTPSALKKFAKELAGYEGSKGAVRFPLDQPIPYALIREIVKFRVQESSKKSRWRPMSSGPIRGLCMRR